MAFIRITLKSDLCAGSGEATGVSVDKDLCISQSGLPYIPARRIKGCLREAAKQLQNYDCPEATNPNIDALFGTNTGIEGCLDLRNAMLPGADAMERWLQSSVPNQLKSAATPLNVARLFTYIRGQTRLKDGVAVKGSLRYTRVLDHYNALEPGQETFLDATVSLRKSEQTTNTKELAILLEKCCKALRHLGSMRNRGLGEIRTELLEKETLISNPSEQPLLHENTDEGKLDTIIRYQVVLNAPVTLPGCAEDLLAIPARSVIGCTANTYLQTGKADDPLFRRLFLDGTVRWSSLTPVTGGLRTVPTPLMLVRLSNEKRYFNLYSAASAFGKKTKALEGTYAVQTENGFRIPAVKTHTVYHHSTGADGTLYMQRSLDAGMIYGGEVYLPAALAKTVESLLQQTSFAFGRSRSAQYATCTLLDAPTSTPKSDEKCETQTGETVYAVLQADLLLSEQGLYEIRNERVRAALAEAFDLDNSPEIAQMDYCFHHSIGGYQTTWQLQKPQVPAVRGGSVYVFRAKGGTVSREKALGELLQEGFGLVRIYTEREMHLLTEIEDAMVDMESVEEASAERCAQLYTALLAAAVREAVRDSVIKLHQKDHVTKDLKKGTIGRLRLMLSEAETYNALLKNVETMKESDKHSQNTTSAKESVKALLKKVYGQKPPSFDALLRRTTEGQRLLDLLQHNERAKERLLETWKEPLDMLLHLAHYEKAKEGQ